MVIVDATVVGGRERAVKGVRCVGRRVCVWEECVCVGGEECVEGKCIIQVVCGKEKGCVFVLGGGEEVYVWRDV